MLTFRSLLESREKEKETELYSALLRMEKHAENSWLSLLGSDPYASYTGIPHIRGVERNVDEAVPKEIKEKFNSTEIFILLASILCHDIGKKVKDDTCEEPKHGCLSCIYILENWYQLLIPREDLARGIAIVCCSHTWSHPIQVTGCSYRYNCQFKCGYKKLSYLDSGLDSDEGYVRLRWVAALLRLSDEVDNHVRRAVPKGFIIPKDENHPLAKPSESWRRHITGIVFDINGKCIRLRTPRYIDSDWKLEEKEYVRTKALKAINDVLLHWGSLLNEIGLDFKESFLDVSLPYPVLLPAVDSFNKDKIGYSVEPVLNAEVFHNVENAIKQLSNAVIGKKDYFTWEALAEESNYHNVDMVRLAVNRLASIKEWPKDKYLVIAKTIRNDYPRNYINIDKKIKKRSNREVSKLAKSQITKKINLKVKSFIRKRLHIQISKNEYEEGEKYFPIMKDLFNIQVSDFGWRVDIDEYDGNLIIEPVQDGERIIPCINVLRDLLSPDIKADETEKTDSTIDKTSSNQETKTNNSEKKEIHGFCARTTKNGKWIAPIIAIEGSSGEGKSTLSLQIANKLANENWICLYYSLEQKADQLLEILNGYNFFENEDNNEKRDKSQSLCEAFIENNWHNLDTTKKKLIFPRLTPRPVGKDISNFSVFDTRYREIKQSLDHICGHRSITNGPPKCVYIIDSLTAFSNHPLSRSEIHRLFELFRQHDVPLIITLERQRNWVNNLEEDHFNIARYLADILISLDSQHTGGYFHQTIEVTKSRFSRRVLGKHLMKIKSTGQKSSGKFDRRTGIAIYPSIHLQLVNSRLDEENTNIKKSDQRFVGIDPDLLPICQNISVKDNPKADPYDGFQAGTCIAIHGAPGGHKFALAMNILMSIRKDNENFGQKLIISLSEENEIQLDGVAFIEGLSDTENIKNHLQRRTPELERGSKIFLQQFGKAGDESSTVTVLNFRLGNIMPEEFLYILEEYLNTRGKEIDTILFSDTVQLRTCFPLLKQEELFLPTLVDFIKSREITSIFIDVHDEDGHPNEALLAAADCRLYVSKEEEIEPSIIKDSKTPRNTIQVDNILGKSYDRNLRYVSVGHDKSKKPVLVISKK